MNLAICVKKPYRNNKLFDTKSPLNRDDCLLVFSLLKSNLEKSGWQCNTYDVCVSDKASIDCILYLDMPRKSTIHRHKKEHDMPKMMVILQESGVIIPRNDRQNNHHYFDSILTWRSDWIERKSYIPFYYPLSYSHEEKNYNDERIVEFSKDYHKLLELIRIFYINNVKLLAIIKNM